MDTISILCPTRERPHLVERMIESLRATTYKDVELLLFVDKDDTFRAEYEEMNEVHQYDNLEVVVFVSKVKNVGTAWNYLYRRSRGTIIMMGNDDLVWKSHGWDFILRERILNEYRSIDDFYVAWADDMSGKSDKHCAFPIVSRNWCETLGYFTPEYFHFLWNDTWIFDIGKKADCLFYLPDIKIEHKHFSFRKSEYDETYRRHRVGKEAKLKRIEDEQLFNTLEDMRSNDALIVRKAIKEQNVLDYQI